MQSAKIIITILITLILFSSSKVLNAKTIVDSTAEFPGGQSAMGKFLQKNLRCKDSYVKANVSGKIVISFTVTKNGEITDIKTLKGVGFGMDEEGIRVVKLMPNWIPAKQNGEFVDSIFNLPISIHCE